MSTKLSEEPGLMRTVGHPCCKMNVDMRAGKIVCHACLEVVFFSCLRKGHEHPIDDVIVCYETEMVPGGRRARG